MDTEISFKDLGLSENILKAVEESGYKTPTLIQKQAIPIILNRQDVIGLSQTGTGKTASFILPILNILDKGRARALMPRTLILTPTRELASQVADSITKYSSHLKLGFCLIIGGESMENQIKGLSKGADIIVATPGRLIDHIKKGSILLTAIEILVIDEADRMMDMGFLGDVEEIINKLPAKRTTLLFSATMPPTIEKLVKNYLNKPHRIEVTAQSSASKNIKQLWVKAITSKRDMLVKLLKQEKNKIVNAIIFCNRKLDSGRLAKWLKEQEFNCEVLNGDIQQNIRKKTLDAFKTGKVKLLVATDIAARGLDINNVGYVFNMDLPLNKEDYIHRIGRTGRAGRSGIAFNIVNEKDLEKIQEIAEMSGDKINWYTLKEKSEKRNNTKMKSPKIQKQEHTNKLGFGDDIPSFMLIDIKSNA